MNKEKKLPLMRKATAVWLVDNTSLTFKQIAEFCGLHELEIQGIADGDVNSGITGQSPIDNNQLTREMIDTCEKDSNKVLELNESIALTIQVKKKKKAKYVPIARRSDKPDGIAYLLKYIPNVTDKQIRKLIGTTTQMIKSIKTRSHWNIKEIKPRDPVLLGLCTQEQFNNVIKEIEETEKKLAKELEKQKKKKEKEKTKKAKKKTTKKAVKKKAGTTKKKTTVRKKKVAKKTTTKTKSKSKAKTKVKTKTKAKATAKPKTKTKKTKAKTKAKK